MAGNLHDIVKIHSAQIHQSGSCSSSCMSVNQIPLRITVPDRGATLSLQNLHTFSQTSLFADILQIAIDDLILKMGERIIILLKNSLQFRADWNTYLCASLFLDKADIHNLLCANLSLSLARILWIRNILNPSFRMSVNLLLGNVIVVRNSLSCPHANHKDIACLVMANSVLAQVGFHDFIQILTSQINAVSLNPGTFELLILPDGVGMKTFAFRDR